MSSRTTLAGALTIAAVALAAPASSARPIDSGPHVRPAAVAEQPPPPSSIAASAGMEYSELRAVQAPPGMEPVARELPAPDGFDWLSAAIGAAVAAGAALVSLSVLNLRRRVASA